MHPKSGNSDFGCKIYSPSPSWSRDRGSRMPAKQVQVLLELWYTHSRSVCSLGTQQTGLNICVYSNRDKFGNLCSNRRVNNICLEMSSLRVNTAVLTTGVNSKACTYIVQKIRQSVHVHTATRENIVDCTMYPYVVQ